jgi:hypothetical protein
LPELTVRYTQTTKPWSMRSNVTTLRLPDPGMWLLLCWAGSHVHPFKCFMNRLKVLGNGAGLAGLEDGIFYMTEREIEASTEVAQTLLDHSK